MLPIYVCYDSGLDAFEVQCIKDALVELKILFPNRVIKDFGSRSWSVGDYSSADWYVNKAKKVLRSSAISQLDAGSLIDLMQSEPWQRNDPHIDVLFTSKDLTITNLNFCFGLARGRITVQSVFRYRRLSNADRELAIKAVVHHELGHIFGCAIDLARANTEMNLGEHCTNYGCIMRQGLSVEEWVKHAKEAKYLKRIYCPQCLADARRSNI